MPATTPIIAGMAGSYDRKNDQARILHCSNLQFSGSSERDKQICLFHQSVGKTIFYSYQKLILF